VAPAPIRVAALAKELGREVEGDGDVAVDGVAALESAGPGDLSFVRSERYAAALAASRAAALIAPAGVDTGARPVIRSPNPGLDFARAARLVVPAARPPAGVHVAAHVEPEAHVDASASIGPGCAVGAYASIGPRTVLHANVTLYEHVTLGADCVVHAGCVLREGTVVGDRVILQPGVVLGADGFGYAVNEDGAFEGMPQLGRVVVGDDVEIGANATVDRGTLGDTTLARGVKIDNLVMVSHNCALGENAMIVAQAGLAGSTSVGRGALILSQAGIVDHVRIGDGAYVGPQSGVTGDVPDGARVLGTPHQDLPRARRVWTLLRRFPELAARLRAIERHLGIERSDGGDAG
jgi:UDP-3-O-[3-hydroxymyristoyl] glucosamine N-acyltransferase